MTLCNKLRRIAEPILAGGALITLLSGWPAHLVRNTYLGEVVSKRYSSGSLNAQNGGRIEVLLNSNDKKIFILDDSFLEWQWGSAKEYKKITIGERYCFETYGFEKATDDKWVPYLYGLHIVEVKPAADCE